MNSSSQKETKETSTSIETNPTEETTVGTITKKSLMSNATGLSNHLINSKGKVDKNLKLNKKNLKKHTEEKKTTKLSIVYKYWYCDYFRRNHLC